MKQFVKQTLFLTASLLVLSSCAKEEFASIKGKQSGSTIEAITTSSMLCAQSTLISPKVDILMLWDNSSSFNFVNAGTKASMSNLIKSVSENFDYHIVSAPLISVSGSTSGTLAGSQIIVKNNEGLSSDVQSYIRDKDEVIRGLNFPPVSTGSTESGVTRTINMLQDNIANGVFRKGAYTIIVIISNEDEKMCPNCDSVGSYDRYIDPKIAQLLAIRGNTSANPSSEGQLNSSMMRFINISRLTSCSQVPGLVNYMYKKTAREIYNASYSNGWPISNDHLSPDLPSFPDSYNLCGKNFSFSNIFDGVNTAIKQTLLLHKYDYWPLASEQARVDIDTVRVVRSDGTILTNRATSDQNIDNGFEIVLDDSGDIKNYTQNTRYFPTEGEPYTGKLIKLFGVEKNDKVIYPDCLTITYTEPKATYGYIYLDKGRPNLSTVSVMINGTIIPQDSTNGWTYIENGPQFTNGIEPDLENYKAFGLPAGLSSGYFLRLNGNARVQNTKSNAFEIRYNSANQ